MFRKFKEDENGNVKMIGMVVGILVTLMIAVLIFFNIAASIDVSGVDDDLQANLGENTTSYLPAANATDSTLEQSATFFTIAPIIAIVVVAVVILGYVSKI